MCLQAPQTPPLGPSVCPCVSRVDPLEGLVVAATVPSTAGSSDHLVGAWDTVPVTFQGGGYLLPTMLAATQLLPIRESQALLV